MNTSALFKAERVTPELERKNAGRYFFAYTKVKNLLEFTVVIYAFYLLND
jgi:hypothetical protein